MMKILCLHGGNQSGQIFRLQLGKAIRAIEESAETNVLFDFTDAPIQCTGSSSALKSDRRAEYKFFDAPTIPEIRKAREWLTTKLATDGPYDGVIGFSQGATLVSSYLLYHQWHGCEDSPPFGFVIFISGSLPLAVLRDLGVPVPIAAERVVEEAGFRYQAELGPSSPHVSLARRAMFNSDDCFGLNLNRVPLELKIRIPTVHVWGMNDPGFPTSIHLAGLCDPYIRKVHTHGGTHEAPQGMEDTQQLSQLLLWCMRRARWPGCLSVQWEERDEKENNSCTQ